MSGRSANSQAQGLGDLLGTPAAIKVALHDGAQLVLAMELARLRPARRAALWRWARNGEYRPASGLVLRRTSRLTVDGLSPNSAAMARMVRPASSPSAMMIRSPADSSRAEMAARESTIGS